MHCSTGPQNRIIFTPPFICFLTSGGTKTLTPNTIYMKTTISLSVLDRLLLPDLLPRNGGIILMTLVDSLLNRIRLTPDEITEYELSDTPDRRIIWNTEKARDKDIEFNASEIKVLRDTIHALDKEGKITLESLPMVKKILAVEVPD